MVKLIISFLLAMPLFLFAQEYKWIEIHSKREYSISGVASFKKGYVVVHDNKKKKQARLSYLNKKLKIKKLVWPEKKLPYDLEAIARFPSKINRYIIMESSGKCYEIEIDPTDLRVDIISTFILPGIKSNMNLEGFNIFSSAQGLVFFYGDRGSDSRPSTLFTADFNRKKTIFTNIQTYKFKLSFPSAKMRGISDLAQLDGKIWTSATSDPGNNGPFSTGLYEIGSFNQAGLFSLTHPELQKPRIVFLNQKVEAMAFISNKLILMTDNENYGSTFLSIKDEIND